jgi:hypothetical protein
MTNQQLLKSLRDCYQAKRIHDTIHAIDAACSQVKLAEFCRQLGIGVKKYKADAVNALANLIHSKP